jgi:hypothetical protein
MREARKLRTRAQLFAGLRACEYCGTFMQRQEARECRAARPPDATAAASLPARRLRERSAAALRSFFSTSRAMPSLTARKLLLLHHAQSHTPFCLPRLSHLVPRRLLLAVPARVLRPWRQGGLRSFRAALRVSSASRCALASRQALTANPPTARSTPSCAAQRAHRVLLRLPLLLRLHE